MAVTWTWVGFLPPFYVCLSVFPHNISKNILPNLTWKCFTMSPGNPFILGSEGQRSRSRVTKTLPVWVFTLLWVLTSIFIDWDGTTGHSAVVMTHNSCRRTTSDDVLSVLPTELRWLPRRAALCCTALRDVITGLHVRYRTYPVGLMLRSIFDVGPMLYPLAWLLSTAPTSNKFDLDSVCFLFVYVCVCVGSVGTITYEWNDLSPRYLAWRFILTISRSNVGQGLLHYQSLSLCTRYKYWWIGRYGIE